jgi:hypothetical protein
MTEQFAELRVFTERIKIRVNLQMGEVVIAEQDRPGERIDCLVGFSGPRQRTAEIVAGKEIVGQHVNEPPIEFNGALYEPLLRDEFGEDAEHFHGIPVAGQQPLEEVDVEVELVEAAKPIVVRRRLRVGPTPVTAHGFTAVVARIIGRGIAGRHLNARVGLAGNKPHSSLLPATALAGRRSLRRRIVWVIPVGIILFLFEVVIEFVVEVVKA